MTKAERTRITNTAGITTHRWCGATANKIKTKKTTGTATPIHPRTTPALAIPLPGSPRLRASPIDTRPRMTARILQINGITVIPRMPSTRDAMAFPSGGACGACGLGSVDIILLIGITSSAIRRARGLGMADLDRTGPGYQPGGRGQPAERGQAPAGSPGRLRPGVAGAPAAPPPAAPDRAGTWVQVRIGTVPAAHAGHGLRTAGIGTGPRRPAEPYSYRTWQPPSWPRART